MSLATLVQFLGLAFVFAFLCYLVYVLFYFFFESIKEGRNKIILAFHNNVNGHLKENYETHLANKFAYYDQLPEKLKVKFLLRLKNFISSKEFHGRGELQVTDEIKTLVAASAVQLTFGLEKYRFDYFSKIIIYPDSYYSTIDGNYHMGETNAMGVIVFSWKDLKEGYDIRNDAFNVGLHEMAHALELEQRLGDDYDFYFANYFDKWSFVAKDEFQNVSDQRESFLRDYAGTNRKEFFAVCVEYFFEKSAEFKSRLPEIYYHLCALLNQDPLATDGAREEKTEPDFNAMLGEVQSSIPIFTSRHSICRAAAYFSFVGLFSLYIFREASEANIKELFGIGLGMIGISLMLVFVSLNTFILYDKYLVINNILGKTRNIYPLSGIVSLSTLTNQGGNYLQVLNMSGGSMKKHVVSYDMNKRDLETLSNLLSEKKVLVKNSSRL